MKKHHFPIYKISHSEFKKIFGGLNEDRNVTTEGSKDLKWFHEYKDTYGKKLQTFPDFKPEESLKTLGLYFKSIFPAEMQNRIRLVGRGVEKVAFVTDSGICFKFQYNTVYND